MNKKQKKMLTRIIVCAVMLIAALGGAYVTVKRKK